MNRPGSDNSYDAIVVGAGVIGLAVAWRLAREGAAVCLVDRSQPGHGVSRVAAGMLAPVAEAAYGEQRLLELTLRSAREFPDFVDEIESCSGRSLGYVRSGALHIALDRDEAAELRRRHRYLTELGLEAEWLGPTRCRELEAGLATSFHGGLQVEAESLVDPREMTAALLAAVEGASSYSDGSVEVRLGREAVEPVIEGDRLAGVRLADRVELFAATVIDACGSRSGVAPWIPEPARVAVRPVKGQILELAPRLGSFAAEEAILGRIVSTGRCYLVPRVDGRLIVGATVEEQGFDETVTAGGVFELLREAYRAVPDIAEMGLVEVSAGLRPGTPDNLPYIGHGSLPGLVHATGHYRNGILLAPLTANAVAAIVAGRRVDDVLAAAAPDRQSRVAA